MLDEDEKQHQSSSGAIIYSDMVNLHVIAA